jgi:hypothetical protein
MCTLPAYAELETILSRSVAIRAEVRSRVYWTNVLVDLKVSVDIIVTGCTGRIYLQQVHEAWRLFAGRYRELQSYVSTIKMRGRQRDRLIRRY